VLLPPWIPVEIAVDETIERRKRARIQAKGRYRDAVRSTQGTVVKCYGLKWISLMLLVPLPWSTRPVGAALFKRSWPPRNGPISRPSGAIRRRWVWTVSGQGNHPLARWAALDVAR